MLNIRQDQLFAFAGALADSWVERAVKLIEKHWPGIHRDTPAAVLRGRVQRTLATARSAGITEGADALRYLNLTLLLGEDFATSGRYRWAARIMNARLSGTAKTALLMDKVSEMVEDAVDA